MACKIQALRLHLWETICRRVEADWDLPVIEDYYIEIEGDYGAIYKEAYLQFYGQGPQEALFQFAGANCEEYVKLLVCLIVGSDRDFRKFKLTLYTFIERQFEAIAGSRPCGCYGAAVCNGDGACLHYCHECFCENEPHTEIDPRDVVGDGHNCLVQCTLGCVPVECANHAMCKKVLPAWSAAVGGGLCYNCAWYYGKIDFIGRVGECLICAEEQPIVKIFCGHELCLGCWKTISKKDGTYLQRPACPVCRQETRSV